MDREQCEVEEEFSEVIPVADGVDRVLEGSREAEDLGRDRWVDRKGAPREGARAEGRYVRPFEGVGEAMVVPRKGPEMGQEEVSERHRLGPLKMRVAGHRRVGVGFRQVQEGELEPHDFLADRRDRFPEIEAFVERDLIVSAPARVEFGAERTETIGETDLDVRVE